jgi:hypothetical protein
MTRTRMEWQPIETAPKDGIEPIIVGRGRKGSGVRGVTQARWDGSRWMAYTFPMEGAQPIEFVAPTHWQPMPRPPR